MSTMGSSSMMEQDGPMGQGPGGHGGPGMMSSSEGPDEMMGGPMNNGPMGPGGPPGGPEDPGSGGPNEQLK